MELNNINKTSDGLLYIPKAVFLKEHLYEDFKTVISIIRGKIDLMFVPCEIYFYKSRSINSYILLNII
jgi:hypothetical protein